MEDFGWRYGRLLHGSGDPRAAAKLQALQYQRYQINKAFYDAVNRDALASLLCDERHQRQLASDYGMPPTAVVCECLQKMVRWASAEQLLSVIRCYGLTLHMIPLPRDFASTDTCAKVYKHFGCDMQMLVALMCEIQSYMMQPTEQATMLREFVTKKQPSAQYAALALRAACTAQPAQFAQHNASLFRIVLGEGPEEKEPALALQGLHSWCAANNPDAFRAMNELPRFGRLAVAALGEAALPSGMGPMPTYLV